LIKHFYSLVKNKITDVTKRHPEVQSKIKGALFDVGKCEKFRDSETEAAWLKQIEVLEAWNAGTIEEVLERWVENV